MRKSPFYLDFHRRYCASFHLPEPSPLQGPYKPLASQEQEQEQDIEQEQENIYATNLFQEFWEAYPTRKGKKVGKSTTREIFLRQTEENQKAILAAVRNYANSDGVKNGYAKDPQRFLKADFWRDWMTPEDSDAGRLLPRPLDDSELASWSFGGAK